MNKQKNLIVILFAAVVFFFSALILTIEAKTDNINNLAQGYSSEKSYSLSESNNLLLSGKKDTEAGSSQGKYQKIKVIITAYSSTTWQTDDTPFETASGLTVKDGIVANNLLPFGTEIKIPELYGDKVFTVEDRMHSRKGNYHVDIWFPTLEQAQKFGVKEAYIEVLSI
jgi:3D (Asp-Asp-Asp) domain-containing protein